MRIMGHVWAPNLLLNSLHMRFQHAFKTLGMLRCPKVKNEGPSVLIMLARKKCPKPSVAWGKPQKRTRKSPQFLIPENAPRGLLREGVGGLCRTRYNFKHSLAGTLPALKQSGAPGPSGLGLGPQGAFGVGTLKAVITSDFGCNLHNLHLTHIMVTIRAPGR